MSLFKWFKKTDVPDQQPKEAQKIVSTVTLAHSNGEVINITIEGTDDKKVAYIANRIKKLFCASSSKYLDPESIDKMWEQCENVWKESEKTFKQLNNMYKKYD